MMGKWTIFDYVDPVDGNLIRIWSARLQKKERAKLNHRLDSLAMHGPGLIPGILSPAGIASIFKIENTWQGSIEAVIMRGSGAGRRGFHSSTGSVRSIRRLCSNGRSIVSFADAREFDQRHAKEGAS